MNCDMEKHISTLYKFLNEGDLEKALNYVETLPKSCINNWQIQNVIGIISRYCGQYEEAVSFFRKALKQNPDCADLYYNLADAYICLKEYQHAELMLNCCEYVSDDTSFSEEIKEMYNVIASEYSENPNQNKENFVLMIAYYFPPLSGSGVFRSIKFAKYLPEVNWKPTVISTDMPPKGWDYKDESLIKEIPDNIDVIRIPDYLSTNREKNIAAKKITGMLKLLKTVLQHNETAINIFLKIINHEEYLSNILTFPCSCLSWAFDVINYIENNMDLEKFDVIYTTSGPYSSHIIGFYMKKKYGIPWVADYRDPWTGNSYYEFNPSNPFAALLFCLEDILLKQADCNITIENSLINDYIQRFKLPENQISCITNGYDEEDFSVLKLRNIRTEKFTISYSGLLYTAQMNVSPVLTALKELADEKSIDLKNIKFKIVGEGYENENINLVNKYQLAEIFEQTGYVSHYEALNSNINSNLLLLLVGDDERFKPVYTGKVFEYLRSGKPIIAIAPKGGAVDRLLSSTGHGETFISTQISAIKNMILKEYQKWLDNNQNEYLHSNLIKMYERKYLTMKLADLLLIAKTSPHKFNEISESVYNAAYQLGGAQSNYHKHYTQSYYYQSWKTAISYMFLLDRNIKILEIGCGAGQFANMLFDNGFFNYKGFDYSDEGIKLALKNNPNHKNAFFVANAFETPEVADKYDLIICFEVLEHIQNDLILLNRIKKETKLLLSVPNFDDPYHVRYFLSEKDVYERYSKVVKIFDIRKSMLGEKNCLYYIIGEKL